MRKFRDQIVEGVGDAFAKAMLQAEAASEENRLEDAIGYLAAAEKLKPEDSRVLELSFNTYLTKQDWEKAGAYMERLARANVDHSEGLHYRIQYALARGDSGRALDQAQQLVREKGEFALSWIVLGKVQAGTGNFEEASKSFLLALERQPQNVEALRGLVQCSYSLRRPEDAKRYIDRIVQLQPNSPAFKELALNHELTHGDPEKVIAARQENLKETPDELRSWQALTQTYMVAARKKASIGDEAGAKERWAKARDTATEAFKKWPDDRGLGLLIGEISLQLKSPADGEKALRALIAQPKWKDRFEPTVMLVDFFMAAGRPADAEKELRQLIANNASATDRPDLQIRLAELLMQQNKPDDAIAVLPADSESEIILRRRVLIQGNAGRFDAAQKELDAMMAKATTPLKQLQLLGLQVELYDRAGKYPEAQKTLDTILAADPKNAMAMLLRGKVRVQRGDYAGAMPDLIAARDALPDNTQARMLLSEAYRNRGEIDAACRELESALRLAPTEKAARITLLNLYSKSTPPRWTQAETLCREAREIPQLAKDPAMIHAEAVMWMERGDLVKSLRLVREALNTAPNDSSIARTFFEVLMRAKQYQEIIQASQKLAETRADLWWVYQQRGLAKCRLKDKDGGLAEFELALKSATEQQDEGASASIVKAIADEVGAAQALARVQARAEKDNRWKQFAAYLCQAQGDTKGAIRWIEQGVSDPNITPQEQLTALRTLGTLYAQLNPPDISKSMAIYRQILEAQPDAIDVLNNLACVMIMPGAPTTPDEALQYSLKAYDLMKQSGRPPEPAIMDTHAAILVLVGRVDEGINLLRDALDRRAFPDAFYHLGDAYLRKAQPDDAEKALKSAQDLILQAEREKQPVDPTLRAKIEEALAKVPQVRQQKASSAVDGEK
jgi:tetratricopeptide (TPR) repeat protein